MYGTDGGKREGDHYTTLKPFTLYIMSSTPEYPKDNTA